MARVTIYTTSSCPYCMQAKRLLQHLAIPYDELDATDDDIRTEMLERSEGRRTVPQILIDGVPIGGYEELRALADSGGLGHLQPANV